MTRKGIRLEFDDLTAGQQKVIAYVFKRTVVPYSDIGNVMRPILFAKGWLCCVRPCRAECKLTHAALMAYIRHRNSPPKVKERTRLIPDQVREIRLLYGDGQQGYSLSMLARQFDVDQSFISMIVHRKRWANVD